LKLLLDEQISGKVADRLRDQGHDVVAVTDETLLRGLGDSDVFEIAQAARALLRRGSRWKELRRLAPGTVLAADRLAGDVL
jgi:hypothetical protein